MIAGTDAASKAPLPLRPRRRCWRQPPWTETSPEWQQLDRDLAPDHPARQIRDAVAQLELSALYDSYAGVGRQAFPPQLMLMLVLFELREGRTSPLQWYRDCVDRDSVKFLLFGLRPSRSYLYEFRRRLGPFLEPLNRLVLAMAQAEGHTTATRVAIDGTFVAALGSRHQLLNEETLAKRLAVLQAALAADAASAGDGPAPQPKAAPAPSPAAATPPPAAPQWLPRTRAGRRHQYRRYRQVQARLEERLKHHARTQTRQRKRCRRSAAQVRICATEPQAALGRDKLKTFRPLYDVQISHDVSTEFVLGYGVYATVTDAGLLPQMLERTAALTGHLPEKVLVDGMYVGDWELGWCAERQIDVYAPVTENDPAAAAKGWLPKSAFTWLPEQHTYRCPEGHELLLAAKKREPREGGREIVVEQYRCPPAHCRVCPRAAACTRNPEKGRTIKRSEHEEQRQALAVRMQQAEGKALYKRRSPSVEPCFGDFKEHRGLTRIRGFGEAMAWLQVGLLVLLRNALALTRRRSATAPRGRLALEVCVEEQAAAEPPPEVPVPGSAAAIAPSGGHDPPAAGSPQLA
jgi:transposase